MSRSWNHNTYYHRALLRRLPRPATRALDVGCGDGQFARLLASRVAHVVAIDVNAEQIDRARGPAGAQHVHWECADLLTMQADAGSFDVVTALAVVHHMPFEQAIERMRSLLVDRGRLLVLGVWPPTATATDAVVSVVAVAANFVLQRLFGKTRMGAPARDPDMSLREVRRRAAELLPGVKVRRRLLWRYILEWDRPAS